VSQDIGRLEKRERDQGKAGQWSSQNTYLLISSPSYVGVVHGAPK